MKGEGAPAGGSFVRSVRSFGRQPRGLGLGPCGLLGGGRPFDAVDFPGYRTSYFGQLFPLNPGGGASHTAFHYTVTF